MNNKDEKLLREFVRRTIVNPAMEILREEKRREDAVRLWVRSQIREFQIQEACTVIYEAKEMANPHPNTGINLLRATLRKAKPNIKTKFQQLTSSKDQRDSFRNHFLAAFVRLFQQLDAMRADGEAPDIDDSEALPAEPEMDDSGADDTVLQEPSDTDLDDISKEIEGLVESLRLTEQEEEEEGEQNDVVSDDLEAEKEAAKNLSQVEKDVEKKKSQERERREFSGGLEGDATGRNLAYDAFNLVQAYFSDSYLDLSDDQDKSMFKKWCLYNLKLLLKSYEEELDLNAAEPEIENPQ